MVSLSLSYILGPFCLQKKDCLLNGDKSGLVYVTSEGFAYTVMHDVIDLSCELQLHNFPFDTQVWPLVHPISELSV